jgi:hypothetical protein
MKFVFSINVAFAAKIKKINFKNYKFMSQNQVFIAVEFFFKIMMRIKMSSTTINHKNK